MKEVENNYIIIYIIYYNIIKILFKNYSVFCTLQKSLIVTCNFVTL